MCYVIDVLYFALRITFCCICC